MIMVGFSQTQKKQKHTACWKIPERKFDDFPIEPPFMDIGFQLPCLIARLYISQQLHGTFIENNMNKHPGWITHGKSWLVKGSNVGLPSFTRGLNHNMEDHPESVIGFM